MTVNVLMADPPREGLVLSRLVETSPLDEAAAAGLYRAMFQDLVSSAADSGGPTLVNYRPEDLLPDAYTTGESVEAELRGYVEEVLPPEDAEAVRYEVQVGSTYDARAGNTVTHLLEEEGETSVAVLDPVAPLLARKDLDSAAMKLRQRDVVLGPGTGGEVHYAAFSDPIDFAGAYTTPELETLTRRARDAGLDVDFVEEHVTVTTGDDLLSLLVHLRARRAAGRIVPEYTATYLDSLDLRVRDGDDGPVLAQG
ncbi:hypothetical protein [Halospeciosus flavus]|uniref:DUF2064 domain-containing protein n=1 Tax=Halospeciosus flavus TaxID=3032283 RepID=A0ABD5Z2T7_9EURY|nr:hypothetical protein [Halospeciosus flavus]